MLDLPIFAILPMILLGGLLAGLVASGVLSLKLSTDGKGAIEASILYSAGGPDYRQERRKTAVF